MTKGQVSCLALLFNKHAFILSKKKKKEKNYTFTIYRLLILNTIYIVRLVSKSLSELTIAKFVIRIFSTAFFQLP